MEQIEQEIYVDDSYPGVTLGALAFPYGTILIDAPPHPDDGLSWQARFHKLGSGTIRLLVNLDSHIDRTIGAWVIDCPIMAHKETTLELNSRPSTFKGQIQNSGAEWETCEELSGIQLAIPSLTFTEQAILEWGEDRIILEHHPGPNAGATWLVVPEKEVIFVGDTVLLNQPPFLAVADVSAWIENLDLLLSQAYRKYQIVSSRGGRVDTKAIREQRRNLKDILKRLERLHNRNAEPEATGSIVPRLLSRIDFPSKCEGQYTQRLSYGLYHYYVRHYYPQENEDQ